MNIFVPHKSNVKILQHKIHNFILIDGYGVIGIYRDRKLEPLTENNIQIATELGYSVSKEPFGVLSDLYKEAKRLCVNYERYITFLIEQGVEFTYFHPVLYKTYFMGISYDDRHELAEDENKHKFIYKLIKQHKLRNEFISHSCCFINGLEKGDKKLLKQKIFPHLKSLTLINEKSYNPNIKGGGNHYLKDVRFEYHIKDEEGITYKELLDGYMRVKGNKRDIWYELFGVAKISDYKTNNEGYIEEMTIKLIFDHKYSS